MAFLQPPRVGTADGPSGYFGNQVDGDVNSGGLMFSIWDSQRGNHHDTGTYPSALASNATWCAHQHAFPLLNNSSQDENPIEVGVIA